MVSVLIKNKTHRAQGNSGGDGCVLCALVVVRVLWVWVDAQTHQDVYLKHMQCLYINYISIQ